MINTPEQKTSEDFTSIKLRLASPDNIHDWSFGEVTRPETINYRTQKPEKDGLFCEKIFGPVKDWECYCGKYKKIRYKGIVCDKCGVEVTRAVVRRERMGHIDLCVPVSHIWFLRGVPSRIGLALDMSIQNLEKVIYFADFIIITVNEDLKAETLAQLKAEYKQYRKQIEGDFDNRIKQLTEKGGDLAEGQIGKLLTQKEEKMTELEDTLNVAESELKELKPLKIISEHTFHDLSLKYGHIFEAGIGAEAIRSLLANMDINKMITGLDKDLEKATGAKRDKLIRRIKFFNHLVKNSIRPEWMVLSTVPIIPPDLRPMVPLDGGRFATSDLNDLYRRVINRNNRLKQLQELNAPEIITRNEKRMLQEAVDALIDNNARHGKTVVASTGQKRMLKSIADMLKGKQGRFRQNLLGKRIDYSGRSVIVVGPELKLDQCGIPKIMALELFKPFIISKLIKRGIVHNVRSANRYIEAGHEEIWDLLEEVVTGAYVLLNRAPTLHRLGIQAFKPVLTEGKAIRIHPLVCSAFNADFDGDQMAVHVPLTEGARKEAAELMLSSKNLLKPSDGRPIVTPNQDIVLGCYYLTTMKENDKPKVYSSFNEALLAEEKGLITLHDQIKVMMPKKGLKIKKMELQDATIGRILFNDILPQEMEFINERITKKYLSKLLGQVLYQFGPEETVKVLDLLKEHGFKYLTHSAQSIGMDDLKDIPDREKFIEEGNVKLDEIEQQYQMGLLTEDERHDKIVELWLKVNNNILSKVQDILPEGNSVRAMIDSGARGTWGQLNQMIGMKGPVVNPSYEVIELPVKSNFKKGFDVLEFFISTHGARKGLTDTALRTSSAGYLTRRLVDVAQDVIVSEEDCNDKDGLELTQTESETMGENLVDRLVGRYPAEDIINPKNNKVLVKAGDLIDEEIAEDLRKVDLQSVKIRAVLSCKTIKGICQKCYGYDLSYNKLVKQGTAVGIIAAQSVGEPGTQLTMRTFHTGGVASEGDITQGLPRVEEIFETRSPKAKAIIADVSGSVRITQGQREIKNSEGKVLVTSSRERVLQLSYDNEIIKKISLPKTKTDLKIEVADGAQIVKGQVLFTNGEDQEISIVDGTVKIEKNSITISGKELGVQEYIIPGHVSLLVQDGDVVEPGDQLTEGSLDLHEVFRLKGQEFTQRYIMREIQHIYSSQGQKLNDKHAEVIVRQMFSKVYVRDAGDSDLLPGEVVEYIDVAYENQRLKKEGKQEVEFDRLLLGITKVSLSTRSWLAAASFQETAKVLINAAITGKTDDLSGLKENIIIGRLIPAGTGFIKK
ncbi:DNA-directed RNA polymerase subunit beta' [Candidatus Falkowbacteria bacterium]|uniref:DNA-directed RNA polymerase subunit beta' n=1 Tax=Candidatus Buchananbacteria bacterium CG10_big_fil_rev_8_21_14_0_10_33_19 TaxID=1974525 RepID=A0A2H0W6U8_9BACT|nr:DNA-directed RNA polymerase subunit beta' [Candidatus Falkowbacteria bacterium]PIS06321.1 MAG: DNA-directed RNA polymerase subunit beta' [Candidatus Buchananbacteria bacterium CG10_big_fil_rev_8_21_14_0_10_33_19]